MNSCHLFTGWLPQTQVIRLSLNYRHLPIRLSFKSADEWNKLPPALLEFVEVATANRSGTSAGETSA